MEHFKNNKDFLVKWNADFKCAYCKNDTFILGDEVYSRNCESCGRQEKRSRIKFFSKAKNTAMRLFSFFF